MGKRDWCIKEIAFSITHTSFFLPTHPSHRHRSKKSEVYGRKLVMMTALAILCIRCLSLSLLTHLIDIEYFNVLVLKSLLLVSMSVLDGLGKTRGEEKRWEETLYYSRKKSTLTNTIIIIPLLHSLSPLRNGNLQHLLHINYFWSERETNRKIRHVPRYSGINEQFGRSAFYSRRGSCWGRWVCTFLLRAWCWRSSIDDRFRWIYARD